MVVGNGLIAKKFQEYVGDDRFLIFASGVSNSKSKVDADYDREFNLLKQELETNVDKLLVYFSTCSILDPSENNSNYVTHKKNIEAFIQSHAKQYLIFRVSNLVGKSGNMNTILNFIVHNIKEGSNFEVWRYATRNLIDVDDFFAITNLIIQERLFVNQVVNVANNRSYSVPEIVEAVEKHFNKKANYSVVAKGVSFEIDISQTRLLVEKLKIDFTGSYLENLLKKYYQES